MQKLLSIPRSQITIDAAAAIGSLEWWRHGLGHGGINAVPLPARVVHGVRKLQPRLIRVFLQEFFQIYPEHGRFDWSRLDPYMDALAATGAKVVAAITLKPCVLFPAVDHRVWRPNDVGEWQRVLFELVKRYSVDRSLVTHWEIGNETDIGESGGAPYLIPDPAEYGAYYEMALPPILEAYPEAKVGGPAACWVDNEPLPGLVERCRASGTRLDFISWHLYSDDPTRHAAGVAKAKALLERFPEPRPEMMVTEWSKSFEPVSVADQAHEPRRAAAIAAALLGMLDAGLTWSFYYHIWDQVCYASDFAPFFSPKGLDGMLRHWNEVPHRFGLFGVDEAVRPQYFVYQMLSRLGNERLPAEVAHPDLRVLAARGEGLVAVLVANFNLPSSQDQVVTLQFAHLAAGRKQLTTYRIDAERRWSPDELELIPLERREVDMRTEFRCQVYCPSDSVVMVQLQNA
jgi:hypothetical protein